MQREDVVFVTPPDEEDEHGFESSIEFRLRGPAFWIDGDQLMTPVELLERDGQSIDGRPALLKQYGASDLLSFLVTEGEGFEEGDRWRLARGDGWYDFERVE